MLMRSVRLLLSPCCTPSFVALSSPCCTSSAGALRGLAVEHAVPPARSLTLTETPSALQADEAAAAGAKVGLGGVGGEGGSGVSVLFLLLEDFWADQSFQWGYARCH